MTRAPSDTPVAAAERNAPRVESLRVDAYRVPTETPQSDGTLCWSSTDLLVVEVTAAGHGGLGYAYTAAAGARLVRDTLAREVEGQNALDVPGLWHRMRRAVRNLGARGVVTSAMAAVDTALWDLKARLLGQPLALLLGRIREAVPVYGSGGFTSYDEHELAEQLGDWARSGMRWVKMKVGRDPDEDLSRVRLAREAIGPDVGLMVDANGAYARKEALAMAEAFAAEGVVWFEEPVSSDDLEGLSLLRNRAPAGMEIAAGEYGYDLDYFRRMLEGGAVDVLQADLTRCAGVTEFLRVAALCEAAHVPLSAHTAPALHLHACTAAPLLRHVEYFHDHQRIERLFFDGVQEPVEGMLRPDLSRAGHGLSLRRQAVEELRVHGEAPARGEDPSPATGPPTRPR